MVARFRTRKLQPELMDDPALDPLMHRRALAGLRRINGWSRVAQSIWTALKEETSKVNPGQTFRILDVGSGGGDLAVRLARLAEQNCTPVRIVGCDISPTAIALASERARKAHLTNVTFHRRDALQDEFPEPRFDAVMCSTFLHHFSTSQAIELLRRMAHATEKLVVVDDLRRTAIGYWLAFFGCRLLTANGVVHVDGPRSVEGAFTASEAKDLALRAGLHNIRVQCHWPQRYLLLWRPNIGAANEQS